MKTAFIRTALAAFAATCATGVAADAEEDGSRQTREFLAQAAQSDTFEMMEASSALAESADPQVIAFAKQMLRDHDRTSAALVMAAAKSGLAFPPMQMDTGQAAFLAALQSARGQAFDTLFWRQQALAHRAALVSEQRYVAKGDAPAVRDVARQSVPVIQSHLAMAEQMAQAADN